MPKQQKNIINVILFFIGLLALLYLLIGINRTLTLLGLALSACIIIITASIIWEKWQNDSYNVKGTLGKVLTLDNCEVINSVNHIIRNVTDIIYGNVTSDNITEEDIFRVSILGAAILSILFGFTICISILNDFLLPNEDNISITNKTELQSIITPSLESNIYLLTTTSSYINSPILRFTQTFRTPAPTFTSTPTFAPTSTPTITRTPTRRIIFGQSLNYSEDALTFVPTPTLFLSEREKNGLPKIVILGFKVSEDDSQQELLLANFGYTIGMANWKLYFDQQLICTFGEYIFWSDTVLTLDVSRNLEERTVDDQLILKCKQVKTLSRQVIIKLQDLSGIEVDQYTYKEMQ